MKQKRIQLYIGDFIIIALVVVLAVTVFFALLPETADETLLEVYQDSVLLYTIPLEEATYTTVEIDGAVQNTIEIDGLQVCISHTNCYDNLCEQMGYISDVGEVIVCMPNKLLLKIVGDSTQTTYDGIVG